MLVNFAYIYSLNLRSFIARFDMFFDIIIFCCSVLCAAFTAQSVGGCVACKYGYDMSNSGIFIEIFDVRPSLLLHILKCVVQGNRYTNDIMIDIDIIAIIIVIFRFIYSNY